MADPLKPISLTLFSDVHSKRTFSIIAFKLTAFSNHKIKLKILIIIIIYTKNK